MPRSRRRPYTRRRTTRKRRSGRRGKRRVSTSSVLRALGSTYPWKLTITHDTGDFETTLNTQAIDWIGTVGAIDPPTADVTFNSNLNENGYRSICFQNNILIPYQATYAVASEESTGRNWSHKFYVKSQKARYMFTNSSVSSMFLELYHCYMRQEMDQTNIRGFSNAIYGANSYTNHQGVVSGTSGSLALTSATPGVTPYDNPSLTSICYIKRVGIKRLEPGANAIHLMRTRRGHKLDPGDTVDDLVDNGYLPKLTCHLIVRFWGEIVSGETAPVMAPVKLVYGCITRTKHKRLSEPIYGGLERGTDRQTMSAGTGGIVIPQENPGASTVGGVGVGVV